MFRTCNFRTLIGAAAMATVLGMASPASAAIIQGFETDTSGWFDGSSGWGGSVTRTTGGVGAFEGSFYGLFSQGPNSTAFVTGPFTRFDGYRDVFPGDYSTQIAIYLDTNWAAGEGFDYSVASNGSDGLHQRDFIFHITKDTSSGSLLVGGSNNTNFDPREDLETINHVEITSSGWYIFEHVFRDDSGVLAVDLNLYDMTLMLLFTETRSTPADTIPGEVGGNRYGWFTNIDIANGLAVDALAISTVPVPAALPLFLSGLGLLGLVGWRRRCAAAS